MISGGSWPNALGRTAGALAAGPIRPRVRSLASAAGTVGDSVLADGGAAGATVVREVPAVAPSHTTSANNRTTPSLSYRIVISPAAPVETLELIRHVDLTEDVGETATAPYRWRQLPPSGVPTSPDARRSFSCSPVSPWHPVIVYSPSSRPGVASADRFPVEPASVRGPRPHPTSESALESHVFVPPLGAERNDILPVAAKVSLPRCDYLNRFFSAVDRRRGWPVG